MKAERLLDLTMSLGEGPVWDEQTNTLHWVDILPCRLWRHDFAGNQTTSQELGNSAGMCCLTQDGGMVAALSHSIVLLKDGTSQVLAENIEPEWPGNRFNDGKCDAAGRLLTGTMDKNGTPGRGSLYRLEEGRPLKKLLGDITVSNGLGWSPDSRFLYYVDTPSGFLWRFEYDLDTGTLQNRTALIDYRGEEGSFDGICVDAEGCLWAAHWGGHQISRWDPKTGRKLLRVDIPAPFVTSCCFGGERMDKLFITTAGEEAARSEGFPLAGSLFIAETGIQGLPAARFGKRG